MRVCGTCLSAKAGPKSIKMKYCLSKDESSYVASWRESGKAKISDKSFAFLSFRQTSGVETAHNKNDATDDVSTIFTLITVVDDNDDGCVCDHGE